MNPLTPYAAAKVANIVLSNKGLDKVVTPQQMYSLARNKKIATIEIGGEKKIYFDGDSFKAWLDDYVEGKATTSGRANFEELAKQFL